MRRSMLRRVQAEPPGFTADLRRRLHYSLYECRVKRPSRRTAARLVGLAPSTLIRFMRGGQIHSRSLDHIVEFVRREARRTEAA